MGWLLLVAYVALTVWVWVSFGVLAGVILGGVGFVIVNIVGPRVDRRFRPRSDTLLEFHEAWDSLIGPPQDVDGLSAKRFHMREWRAERKKTRESAFVWLARKIGVEGDPYDDVLLRGRRLSPQLEEQQLEQIGAEWDSRDHFDRPELRVRVVFFEERSGEWRDGTVILNIRPGDYGLGSDVRIWDGESNVYWTWEKTWLVERYDLEYRRLAYELRGFTSGSSQVEPSIRRVVFVAQESGTEELRKFLDARGPDVAQWIKVEPDDWERLTPPCPPT